MTDSDIRTLKSYLTECLEPALKFNKERLAEQTIISATAFNTGDMVGYAHANNLKQYFTGKVLAFESAIDDLKELFEEELKEGE